MNQHPWYPFCLKEIDDAVARGRRLNNWERDFLTTARERIERSLGLTDKQEKSLLDLRNKMTEMRRIKW